MVAAPSANTKAEASADPCRQTRPATIRDLLSELRDMHDAAGRFLTQDKSRTAYWTHWERQVVAARQRVRSNRQQFYVLRMTALVSGISVPALVGLNLAGSGGIAVRWITFALSLIAALSAAGLSLFAFRERWLMYRTFETSLTDAGWTLLNSEAEPAKAWSTFVEATDKAISTYNRAYRTSVILVTEGTHDSDKPK